MQFYRRKFKFLTTYEIHIYLKWSKLWKYTIFTTLVKKIWTVKFPGILGQTKQHPMQIIN